jgi:ligand-binding SRPBCC domain-containing protein
MLIRSKGDMIRLGTPSTSSNRLLVSGGELFVRMRKEGQALLLAPGAKITLRYNDVPISTQMRFFTGDLSNPDRFNWVPNTNSQNNSIAFTSQTYEIQTNQLSWVGCHYFYDTTGITQVTVTANLPSNYTNANTVAYTVFKDFRSVAGMYGEAGARKFSTGMLPVGKAVTIVVISKQGNDYFMGYQNTVTTAPAAGASTQSVTITPVIRSLSDILSFLSTL